MTMSRRAVLAAAPLAASAFIRPARAQAVSLNFWDMIWGPPQYIDAARALVARFNAETPSIQVTYRSVPWANWFQTFVTAVGAGTAPDVSTGGGFQAVNLYSQGAVRPADAVVDALRASGALADFAPGTLDAMRYDNHYVAIPWGLDIRSWFYRKDHFAAANLEPPRSWTELRDTAKRLTTAERFGLVGASDTRGMQYLVTAMINNGGGVFSAERQLDLAGERNREALELLSAMVRDGSVHGGSAGFSSQESNRAFFQGQASIVAAPGAMPDQAPPDVADKIGIIPPMAGVHGDKHTLLFINNIMIYQQTRHPAEAATFLAWWSANAKPLWTQGRCQQIPVRSSIASDPYFQNNPITRAVMESYVPIGKTLATRSVGTFPKLHEVDGDGTLVTLAQQLFQGRDLGPAMATAERRLREVLR
jgi:multiple sugar transport system substrate-binding protein